MRRSALVILLALVACLAAAMQASSATSPALRLGGSSDLSVVATGFKPRALVTLRVAGAGLERSVTRRTGPRGGVTFRLPGVNRCDARLVVARGTNGAVARVSVLWLVRNCPPPPPIQP